MIYSSKDATYIYKCVLDEGQYNKTWIGVFFIVLTRLPVLFYAAVVVVVVVVVFIAHIPFTQRKEEKNEIVTFMY